MKNLVSVVIPTFNRCSYLGESLESVISQTFTNWECIVIDDGSTDHTPQLMEFYCERYPQIQYKKRPDELSKGANSCRNFGVRLSTGKYIQFLDSDDLISNNKFHEQIERLEKEGNANTIATTKWGVFTGEERKLFQNLKSYSTYNDPKEFLVNLYRSYGYFPPHAYLIPKELIEKTGGWNEYLRINQDGEFMTRIICNTKKFLFSEKSYVLYRASRKDSTSLITQENIFDHYHCLKLIESYLMIRFKGEMIPEFQIIKKKAFYRIPDDLSFIYQNEKSFFHKEFKEKKKNQPFLKRLKKNLKKFLKGIK